MTDFLLYEELRVPELPEIERICAGITPHITGNTVAKIVVHTANLRWPISPELSCLLPGQTIQSIERRGKYILLNCQIGGVLIHLGMTGHLRILSKAALLGKHDHFDLVFQNGIVLRLNDVRRFGAVLWAGPNPKSHKLLVDLGLEPLTDTFDGTYLYHKSRARKITVKQFIMDHKVVVGIGNIYANEALFHAGIRPSTPVGRLSQSRCQQLVKAIKAVLTTSIKVGGTMYYSCDGIERQGYFSQHLMVYNREGEPCHACGSIVQYKRVGQRSIYYCNRCQR